MTDTHGPTLTAYQLYATPFRLIPASSRREWMDRTPGGFARRCLPMLIANGSGWWVVAGERITAVWDGGPHVGALTATLPAVSHFGGGVVTVTLPWLFRTSEGVDLLVRGPANLPKRGATALEGVVETDWNPATFTVNWQMTEPGREVVWEADEPIAMIVPQGRGVLEGVRAEVTMMGDHPDVWAEFEYWQRQREEFNRRLAAGDREAVRRGWEKDYVRGARRTRVSLEVAGP